MGRLETWLTFLLTLAAAIAAIAVGIVQAGEPNMAPYVSDFDLTVKSLFVLAALAFLGSLLCGGKLAVEWWKGKRAVSDTPTGDQGPSISGTGHNISVGQTGGDVHQTQHHHYGPQARTLVGRNVASEVRRLLSYRGTEAEVSSLGGPEPTQFCIDIRELLALAEWNAHLGAMQMITTPFSGVRIIAEESSLAAQELQQVLQSMGRSATVVPPGRQGAPIHIIVGGHDGQP